MAERLVATTGFRYGGKFMKAGDTFTPRNERDALVLRATKRAKAAGETEAQRLAKRERMPTWPPVVPPPAPLVETQTPEIPPPPQPVPPSPTPPPPHDLPPQPLPEPPPQVPPAPPPAAEPTVDSDLVVQGLRERAEAMGIHVDRRWGAERLRQAIADAQPDRYSRRDLRARE